MYHINCFDIVTGAHPHSHTHALTHTHELERHRITSYISESNLIQFMSINCNDMRWSTYCISIYSFPAPVFSTHTQCALCAVRMCVYLLHSCALHIGTWNCQKCQVHIFFFRDSIPHDTMHRWIGQVHMSRVN